ncbi:MAG: hypothetical protein UCO54_06165 [Segatella copri]|nr:hypothetical protein [Segatella copri]
MEKCVNIEVLPAREGDCIFITVETEDSPFTIMIDGGVKTTYQFRDRKQRFKDGPLKVKINELREKHQKIDLLILTHVDEDHLGGIVEWIAKDENALDMIGTILMNNGDQIPVPDYSSLLHSIPKGRNLDKLLRDAHKNVVNQVVKGKVFTIPHGKMTILTPTVASHNVIAEKWNGDVLHKTPADYGKPIKTLLKYDFTEKDESKTNNSSISFVLEIDGRKDLFLGDADIDEVCLSLDELGYSNEHPLCCKTVKLSHHGSRKNFSSRLLELVKAEVFIFSTNGDYYGHPDKEVFAQIIDKTCAKVYFNYKDRFEKILCEQDLVEYPDIKNRIIDNLNG